MFLTQFGIPLTFLIGPNTRAMAENEELEHLKNRAQEVWGAENPEYAELIKTALEAGVKIKIERVLHIWQITNRYNIRGLQHHIVWIEQGTDKAGYQHMLKHKEDFEILGVPEDKLIEVAEAATSVGYPDGFQGPDPGRPILGLFFHGRPLAVAISVGSNGFVVGMNPSNFNNFINKTAISLNDLHGLNSWPKTTEI